MDTFNSLSINPSILKGIARMQFDEMTEVQKEVIPIALQESDLIVQAPTGTGKTIAFAIPILNKIDSNSNKIQAVIISPTRELAVQISEEIKTVAYYIKDLKVVCVYGGENIERQITSLKKYPQVIVATPGRLMDHMRRGTIKLGNVDMLVLDEADEMLNMGFKEDIDTILESVPNEHQTMLFSATVSKEIEGIARSYLKNPKTIKINKNELTVPAITQKYIELKVADKIEVISRIIDINEYKLIMIFCNTKREVDKVASSLLMRGYIVESLHGDMKQMQRDRVMQRFRGGQVDILVASDVAARGLDIDDVDVVFNYDVPTDEEYYVHRIGRTGRAKKEGMAITLVTRTEKYRLKGIMLYSKAVITSMEIPSGNSVMKVRINRIIKEALKNQEDAKPNKILDKVLSEIDEYTRHSLLQGLILMQLGEMDIISFTPETSNNNVSSTDNRRKSSNVNTKRVFLGVGKKDKIKVPNLIDLIIKNTNLVNNDINDFEMHENFSFLSVPAKSIDEVINTFTSNRINGKYIIVEEAKQKKQSSNMDLNNKSDYNKTESNRRREGSTRSKSDFDKRRANSGSDKVESSKRKGKVSTREIKQGRTPKYN